MGHPRGAHQTRPCYNTRSGASEQGACGSNLYQDGTQARPYCFQRGPWGVMGREEPRTGGVGMESGILPKQFGRSDLPDGVEVLGGSESQTSPSQKAAERLKPLWSSPDEWNDDNRHLPYMSEATRERACNKPARTPKPVRVLQSVAHGLPTATVNTSPLERPGRGLHGSSDFGPHKE